MRKFLVWAFVACALPAGAAHALDASGPPVVVSVVGTYSKTASGQPITLPQKNVQVIVSTYDIAPGARLPVHKHPSARYASVHAGTLEVTNVDKGTSTIYRTGDFIVEMVGEWHRATNIGADAVKLLVIDQIEEGTQNTILQQ